MDATHRTNRVATTRTLFEFFLCSSHRVNSPRRMLHSLVLVSCASGQPAVSCVSGHTTASCASGQLAVSCVSGQPAVSCLCRYLYFYLSVLLHHILASFDRSTPDFPFPISSAPCVLLHSFSLCFLSSDNFVSRSSLDSPATDTLTRGGAASAHNTRFSLGFRCGVGPE